jgi:dimethylargininase
MNPLPPHRYALTRRPGLSFAEGITTAGLGAPDLAKAMDQHAAYVQALRDNGLEVAVLDADERFPDGCFVEDTAVVLPEIAVIACPGAESRRGEPEAVAAALARHRPLAYLRERDALARLDGGDVLQIEKCLYAGLSARTNAAGIAALAAVVGPFGYTVYAVPVQDILHLKTGVTYAGKNILVAQESFSALPVFKEFEKITTPSGESYAANILKINDKIIVPKGFPEVARQLSARGFHLAAPVDMSEFQKMDGGLTCLSILY